MSKYSGIAHYQDFNELVKLLGQSNSTYDIDKITKAYKFAEKAHGDQRRVSGIPYILHPTSVACILAELGMDTDAICAALLHDVAEDTDITLSELESEFPSAVIDVLKLLTHKDGIDYFDYIRAIRSNPTAVRVKLADIAHNSDETRYAGCSEIDAEQLAARRKKYEKAKAILQAKN